MDPLTIIGIIAAVIVLFIIFLYNSLISLRNQVKNSWAQIDIQLKRRNDLITNLIETVKGYMKHEKSVLENVTKARSAILKADTVEGKAKASNMLSQTKDVSICILLSISKYNEKGKYWHVTGLKLYPFSL